MNDGFLRDDDVAVDCAGATVLGRLTIPREPRGMVVFTHGSGSSRHSPRNRFVAEVLQAAGLGTLLFDLLTDAEERDRATVFDIDLLSARLVDLNRHAAAQIPGQSKVVVVNGATHLFEEPGTLEQVALLARQWFTDHLTPIPLPL